MTPSVGGPTLPTVNSPKYTEGSGHISRIDHISAAPYIDTNDKSLGHSNSNQVLHLPAIIDNSL